MSQGDLANILDVLPKELSNYERGQNLPKIDRLAAIADALGVDIADLFAPPETPVTVADRFSGDVLKIALFVQRLAAKDAAIASRILKALRALFAK